MKTKEAVPNKLNKQEKVAVINLLRYFINNVRIAYIPYGYMKHIFERKEHWKICAILEEYRISLGVKDEECKVKIHPYFPPGCSLNEVSLKEILNVFKGIKVLDMVLVEISYFEEKLKSSSIMYDSMNYLEIKSLIYVRKDILKTIKMNDIEIRDILENLDEKEIKEAVAEYSSDYLSLVLEYGNTDELLEAIETITKLKGFIQVPKNTRLERESLYKTFFKGTMRQFDTVGRYCAPLM